MRLTVDGEVYDFDPMKITNVEGMAVEKHTRMLYNDWAEAVNQGSMLARTALVWIVRKRQEPTLLFDQVLFTSLDIEHEAADASDPDEPVSASEPAD